MEKEKLQSIPQLPNYIRPTAPHQNCANPRLKTVSLDWQESQAIGTGFIFSSQHVHWLVTYVKKRG